MHLTVIGKPIGRKCERDSCLYHKVEVTYGDNHLDYLFFFTPKQARSAFHPARYRT